MRRLLALGMLAAACAVLPARALDIEGVKIDEKITLAKGLPELEIGRAHV